MNMTNVANREYKTIFMGATLFVFWSLGCLFKFRVEDRRGCSCILIYISIYIYVYVCYNVIL